MWKLKRVCVSLIVFGALLALMPRAQAQSEQQVSVAEAARRAREQKKDAAKPVTVVTNDTLEPARNETPAAAPAAATNLAGAAQQGTDLTVASATGSQQAATGATGNPATKEAPADDATSKVELKALRQEIADKQTEVDLAQRELTLASDDFYSRPDFSQDTTGKAKLEAMQSNVAQKQDELAQLKAKLPAGASAEEEKPASDQAQPDQSQQTQAPQQP